VLALDVTASYAVYGLIAEPGSLPGASWAALFSSSTWPAFYAPLEWPLSERARSRQHRREPPTRPPPRPCARWAQSSDRLLARAVGASSAEQVLLIAEAVDGDRLEPAARRLPASPVDLRRAVRGAPPSAAAAWTARSRASLRQRRSNPSLLSSTRSSSSSTVLRYSQQRAGPTFAPLASRG